MGQIPRSILAVGLVSFLTDVSSEMIYPLLPVFLVGVLGATPTIFGLIDGTAETVAALLKWASGYWTDLFSKRKLLMGIGYSLSSLIRPLVGLANTWPFVFFCRVADRVGKGIRTAPRDALIADITEPSLRAKAYSIHRSMDHAGALTGPIIATLLLLIPGMTVKNVFLLAIIPGILSILVIYFFVEESEKKISDAKEKPGNPIKDLKKMGSQFHLLITSVFVFALGNSSDAFYLLRLKEVGVSETWIPLVWALHSGVKMLSVYFMGPLSDKKGHLNMIQLGWTLNTLILISFCFVDSRDGLIALFLVYGAYYGLVEAPERAWISTVAPAHLKGSAFGLFHMVTGLAFLPANLLFGWIWTKWGAPFAFFTAAIFSAIALVMLAKMNGRGAKNTPNPIS